MGNFTVMPQLGMTMTEGKIIKRLINEGERVAKGDYIYEVETDKTSLEVDSLYSGILLKQYYEEGEDVPCDLPVGFIGEEGEDIPEIEKYKATGETQSEETLASIPFDKPTKKAKAKPLIDDGKV